MDVPLGVFWQVSHRDLVDLLKAGLSITLHVIDSLSQRCVPDTVDCELKFEAPLGANRPDVGIDDIAGRCRLCGDTVLLDVLGFCCTRG